MALKVYTLFLFEQCWKAKMKTKPSHHHPTLKYVPNQKWRSCSGLQSHPKVDEPLLSLALASFPWLPWEMCALGIKEKSPTFRMLASLCRTTQSWGQSPE